MFTEMGVNLKLLATLSFNCMAGVASAPGQQTDKDIKGEQEGISQVQ